MMSKIVPFDVYNVPRIIYGEGVSKNVSDLLKALNAKTIMAVYDQGVKKAGIVDAVLAPIREAGFAVEEFGDVIADPPADMIDEAVRQFDKESIDVYVAIGGGGVIDTAKCMAVMHTNPGKLLDYLLGVGKPIPNFSARLIAVPTTSGTGSEATALSIITDTATSRKVCVKDVIKMCPFAAYLDPTLTLGLPKGLTASTGMDALSHAVEAFLVGRHNEYSDMFCENTIRRVVKWLPVAVEDGKNLEARGQMMQAATYGGISFASSTLQAGHAVAHALGGALHVPHGIACAWGVNFAIKHSGKTVPIERLRLLADYMGVDASVQGREALVAACCKVVKDMNDSLNIPTPKTFGIGSREEMEAAYNACWNNEQGMLGVGGVTDKNELYAYFEEMWAW